MQGNIPWKESAKERHVKLRWMISSTEIFQKSPTVTFWGIIHRTVFLEYTPGVVLQSNKYTDVSCSLN